ncbi:MAG: serine hydrolase [Ekhidna sp.]
MLTWAGAIRCIALILLQLFVLTGKGQISTSRIDDYVSQSVMKMPIPNLDIAIVQGDSLIYSYGDLENVHYLGSVSKSLTAFATLKMIQDSLITFKTRVVNILPVKFSDFGQDITIKTLLQHTSGISKVSGFLEIPEHATIEDGNYEIDISFPPGSKHEYSNLNYALLGLIIEKISNQPFDKFLEEKLFQPLHMRRATVGLREVVKDYVSDQFQYIGPWPILSSQMEYERTTIPAGFICASANDMINYLVANLNKGSFNRQQVLDTVLVEIMRDPWGDEDYGYTIGWKKGWYNHKPFYQHLGSTATSYSGIFFFPDSNIGLVVLSNTNSLSFTESMMEGLVALISGTDPPIPTSKEYYLRSIILVVGLFAILFNVFLIYKVRLNNSVVYKKKVAVKSTIIHTLLIVTTMITFPIITQVPFYTFLKIQPDIGTLILIMLISPLVLSCLKLYKSSINSSKA